MSLDSNWPVKFSQDTWTVLTAELEGDAVVNHMFMVQDAQVATGYGITWTGRARAPQGKVEAKRLSWTYKAGHPKQYMACSPEDIDKDYDTALDAEPRLYMTNGHLAEWRGLMQCRTDKRSLLREVFRKVAGNARKLRSLISNFDNLPADAQLCALSMSWAFGPNWEALENVNRKLFLKLDGFRRACQQMDFVEAAKYATYENKENSLQKRAKYQQQMMANADSVSRGRGNFDDCYWPGTVPFGAPAIDSSIQGRPDFGATI